MVYVGIYNPVRKITVASCLEFSVCVCVCVEGGGAWMFTSVLERQRATVFITKLSGEGAVQR